MPATISKKLDADYSSILTGAAPSGGKKYSATARGGAVEIFFNGTSATAPAAGTKGHSIADGQTEPLEISAGDYCYARDLDGFGDSWLVLTEMD